jgi:hypothetical protein
MLRAIAFAVLAFATGAYAQPYIFVGGGQVKSHAASAERGANDAALSADGFSVTSSDQTTSATTFTIGAGYQLSKHFSAQVAYSDLGQLQQYSGTFEMGPVNDQVAGNQSKKWEASGYEVSIIASMPVSQNFSLDAKAGIFQMTGEYRTDTRVFVVSCPPVPPSTSCATAGQTVSRTSESASGSSTLPILGIGVSYRLFDELRLRAMLEYLGSKADAFGAGNDLEKIRLFSITAGYLF